MKAPDDLTNKGIILNRSSVGEGRTFIVTGLYRSGTSLVANILQQAGPFMGREINEVVFEDEAIAGALASGDMAALQQLISERNANCARWGFKYPMLCDAFPHDFVDAIMRFCDIPQTNELRGRLLAVIEPNRQRYIAGARRRYEGLIEGIRDRQLYGWCRLTHSADPLTLDVLVNDRVALRVVADSFRQDLLDAGIGSGRQGFFIGIEALQARPDSVVRIAVVPYGVELDNSGTRLRDFRASA